MPSNMVLPVYSGDKNKDGGLRRVIAGRFLHARLFVSRFKLPIALMIAVVVAVVLLSSPSLPQPPPDVGSPNRPDLRVGIGQVNQAGDEKPNPNPNPKPDANAKPNGEEAAGVQLPSRDDAERLRQEQQRREAEQAEERAAEERAAAERAAAEQQHREEQEKNAGNNNIDENKKAETNAGGGGGGDEKPAPGDENANGGGEGKEALPGPGPQIRMPETQEEAGDAVARERQTAVREAFVHAWRNYEKYAWGFDELRPQSRQGMNWLSTGLGATIVDSLSTMHIMGLRDEFVKARNWVDTELPAHLDAAGSLSFFECTIRILGGLVSAHDLTNDPVFLDRAKNVADRLMKAFQSPTGLPRATVNFRDGSASSHGWTRGNSILAEVGTIQMEFCTLAKKLNDTKYCDTVMRVLKVLSAASKPKHGLYPYYINPETGQFNGQQVSLGALGDSFYEYLLKLWVLTGKRLNDMKKMYVEQSDLIDKTLIMHNNHWMYIAELNGQGQVDPKMDHLACFVGGMFGLGAAADAVPAAMKARHMEIGKGIGEVCHQMYAQFPFGLSPESVRFTDTDMRPAGVYYIQRPEAVEAMFYMWRLTKDPVWREYGWEVFQAIVKNCKTEAGFAGIRDVTNRANGPIQDDQQQSFFLAETLKYIYLLFSPDTLIPLDEWVFNTEAHPMRVWQDASAAKYFTVFGDPAPEADQQPVAPPA